MNSETSDAARLYRGLFLLLGFVLTAVFLQAQTALVKGQVYERDLAAGETQTFEIELDTGLFVYGEADQQTVDVVVALFDPDGHPVDLFDGPGRGPEPFQFKTELSGNYRIEITPFEAETGHYVLRLLRVEPLATSPEDRLDQLMAANTGDDRPGAVVGFFQSGKLTFAKAYGMADLTHGIPNTTETLFNIGSTSKQFAGIAFAMLAEQGLLKLDDDVRKYLPELPDFGTTVTLRHLLNHTSGYREVYGVLALEGRMVNGDILKREDAIAVVQRQPELQFEPGSEWLYNSSGYVLLTTITERITGVPYPDWMRENVFDPLGMDATYIEREPGEVIPGAAYSYRAMSTGNYREDFESYNYYGATDVYTNLTDLAKWLRNFETMEVGGPGAWKLMLEKSLLTNGDTLDYTLGLFVDEYRGLSRIQHGGATGGYRTFLAYFPDLEAGVVAMSNTGAIRLGSVSTLVIEAFLGEQLEPVEARPEQASVEEDPSPPDKKVLPSKLEAYTGHFFSNEVEAFYTITVVKGRLNVYHRRLGDISLRAGKKDHFSGPWPLSELVFDRDGAGEISGFRVSSGRMRNVLFERID